MSSMTEINQQLLGTGCNLNEMMNMPVILTLLHHKIQVDSRTWSNEMRLDPSFKSLRICSHWQIPRFTEEYIHETWYMKVWIQNSYWPNTADWQDYLWIKPVLSLMELWVAGYRFNLKAANANLKAQGIIQKILTCLVAHHSAKQCRERIKALKQN